MKAAVKPDLLFEAHSPAMDILFYDGQQVSGKDRAEVWGRSTALAIAKDGALLVADDTAGTIWRITYTGPRAQTDKPQSTGGHRHAEPPGTRHSWTGSVLPDIRDGGESYLNTSACSGNRAALPLDDGAALPLDFDAAAGAVGAASFIPVSKKSMPS